MAARKRNLRLDQVIVAVFLIAGFGLLLKSLQSLTPGQVNAALTVLVLLAIAVAAWLIVRRSFPKAKLAPIDDPFGFAEVQAFNSYLCSTVHINHAHRPRGSRWADDPAALEAMKKKVPETMAACFDLIESKMMKGPWVMGDTYTICDPYLFTIAGWLEGDSVDPARFPKVKAHRDHMSQRAAVQKALAAEKA